MKGPTRMKYDDDAGSRARALLANARRPRPMTGEERRRAVDRAAKIASIPAAASALLWAKGVAIASVAAFTWVAAAKLVAPKPFGDPQHQSVATIDARLSRRLPLLAAASTARPEASSAVEAAVVAPSSAAPPDETPLRGARAGIARDESSRRAASVGVASEGVHGATAATATVPSGASAAPSKDDPLAREAAMLEAARAALDADPARALAALDAHARAFPAGQLAPEREVLRVDALRRLGRTSEAAARGSAILSEGSSRLYQDRVRKVLDAPHGTTANP